LRVIRVNRDFTPAGFWQIDRFFDEQTQGGTAKLGGLLSQDPRPEFLAVRGRRVYWRGYTGENVAASRRMTTIPAENPFLLNHQVLRALFSTPLLKDPL